MTNLVFIQNDQAVTSTLVIASETGNEHRAVLQLARKYLPDLEEFGRVAFEMRPFQTAGGPQQREVAILNEPQTTLLLTYMRNSEVVRTFKKALVGEFYRMATQLRGPQYSQAALDERDARLKAEIVAEVNRLIENKRFLTQRKVLRSMDVGEQLGITAREFNRTAVELGLMTAHRCGPDDTLAFLLTNEGMKYGRMASGGRRFHERGYTFTTTMWWVEDVIGYVRSFDGQRLMISIPEKPRQGQKGIPMSQSAIDALNKVH